MENFVETEERKEWVKPALQKVSIEEITAHLNLLRPMKEDDPS